MEILRKALARERLEYDGETYTLPLPDGPGKALKLMIGPVQERIPIYIAAIGPKNTQLTGEIADGWMPTFFSPEHVGESPQAARGGRRAGAAGKAIDDSFDIAPTVNVCIDDDVDRRPRRDAADPRAVRRRDGLAREELLQRSSCSATGSRRRPTRCRTSTSTARRTRPPPRCRPS